MATISRPLERAWGRRPAWWRLMIIAIAAILAMIFLLDLVLPPVIYRNAGCKIVTAWFNTSALECIDGENRAFSANLGWWNEGFLQTTSSWGIISELAVSRRFLLGGDLMALTTADTLTIDHTVLPPERRWVLTNGAWLAHIFSDIVGLLASVMVIALAILLQPWPGPARRPMLPPVVDDLLVSHPYPGGAGPPPPPLATTGTRPTRSHASETGALPLIPDQPTASARLATEINRPSRSSRQAPRDEHSLELGWLLHPETRRQAEETVSARLARDNAAPGDQRRRLDIVDQPSVVAPGQQRQTGIGEAALPPLREAALPPFLAMRQSETLQAGPARVPSQVADWQQQPHRLACPRCRTPLSALVEAVLRLPGDSDFEPIDLELLACPACNLVGVAVAAEIRASLTSGTAIDRWLYPISALAQARLSHLFERCPTPDDPECRCPGHRQLVAYDQDGHWCGMSPFASDPPLRLAEEHSSRPWQRRRTEPTQPDSLTTRRSIAPIPPVPPVPPVPSVPSVAEQDKEHYQSLATPSVQTEPAQSLATEPAIGHARHPAAPIDQDELMEPGLEHPAPAEPPASHRPPIGEIAPQMNIQWQATGERAAPFQAIIGDKIWQLRLNDQSDRSLYTLYIAGEAVWDFDDFPSTWTRTHL